MTDPLRVTALAHTMLDSLQYEEDYSTSELVSACLTVAKQVIEAVLEKAPETAPMLQNAVQHLLLACVDPTQKPN